MTSLTPPQGINDVDYEAIEAAVTETVRGRWFLNEFARRNRASEMRQLMDAMGRLEATVASSQSQPALPSADPSIRLLIQRIKEIAGQLDGLARDMREAGVDERFCDAADLQARAVAGMMRNTVPARPSPRETPSQVPPPQVPAPQVTAPQVPAPQVTAPQGSPQGSAPQVPASRPALVVSRNDAPTPAAPVEPAAEPAPTPDEASAAPLGDDPRRAALSGLDDLPLAKKLALFS